MGVGPMSHMHPNLAANMPANMAANMGPMSHWHGMPIMPGSIPPGSFSQMSHMPMPHSFGGMGKCGGWGGGGVCCVCVVCMVCVSVCVCVCIHFTRRTAVLGYLGTYFGLTWDV